VSGVPFATPSVFADMALVMGKYLADSLMTSEARNKILLDFGDMVAHKVLIPHGQGFQPVRGELEVKWATGSPYTPATAKCRFYSVNPKTGKEASEHVWCTLDFVAEPCPAMVAKKAEAMTGKRKRVLDGTNKGEIVRYNKAGGYRLMTTVTHFAPDYKPLDDMILDDVALEAACSINLSTVSPEGSYVAHPGHIDSFT
jgi:hypothetical protein